MILYPSPVPSACPVGLDWAGLDCIGSDWIGLGKVTHTHTHNDEERRLAHVSHLKSTDYEGYGWAGAMCHMWLRV